MFDNKNSTEEKPLQVGLLFGGRSAEHEVSLMSARSVYSRVALKGVRWVPLAISQSGKWLNQEVSTKLITGEIDRIPQKFEEEHNSLLASVKKNLPSTIDLIFPLLHGPYGEDGKMQGFLQTLSIPFVGSKTAASAVAMDKSFAKNIFERHNIRQAKYFLLTAEDIKDKESIVKLEERLVKEIDIPCFVKPASLGSSIGISKVKELKELLPAIRLALEYDDRILIEEFIAGREIECSVLGDWQECEASKPGEIIPGHEFYDYEAKYFSNKTNLVTPAQLPAKIEQQIRELACRSFRLLYCDGLSRVDFFVQENNEIYLNEINTLPGFTEKSMYTRMWEATGLSYEAVVEKLLKLALKD